MRTSPITGLLAVAVATAALISGPTASAAAQKPKQPAGTVGTATNSVVPKSVANFTFVTQAGAKVSLSSYAGKTIFLLPLLTLCPDTCPFTSANALMVDQQLAANKATGNVEILFFDTDPYRDTPGRLSTYEKLVGLNKYPNVEFLTEVPTAAPVSGTPTPTNADAAYPAENTFANFFGMQVQKVTEGKPASIDWQAPHEKLTYDISHSDGFFVIDAAGALRFVSGNPPHFKGTLNSSLRAFLGADGAYALRHPYTPGWKPGDAEAAISWVLGRSV